ncbi:MAG: sensor histidine kinase [Rhodospirillales bacterium]
MPFATDQERTLTNLLVSVMNAREQEGARISRILHDEVGQVLSAIGLQLDLLRMDITENKEEGARRIAEIQKVLETAVNQVRELSYELNPSIVERTGLPFALDRLVGRYRRSFDGNIRLLFDSSVRVPVEPATALYKIAEQALENAVQHSGGRQVEILVKPAKQGVALEIRDNGKGFSLEKDAGGVGLHLMKHHAVQAGIQFSVASVPEKGTIVRAIYRAAEKRK